MYSSKQITSVIKKFPHSEVRIPYTYHHDYVRGHVSKYSGYSRGDVAQLKNWTNEELYATALIYILDYSKARVFVEAELTEEDKAICKWALETTEKYINNI